MRQIKVIVMAVGVAFSAAPFFNYAVAQQSNGQANLMLEVQSLRQEIAQLRDMVERQQFEMRKLKRQQLELQKAASSADSNNIIDSSNSTAPTLGGSDSYQSSSNYPSELDSSREQPSGQSSNYGAIDNSATQSVSSVSSNSTIIEERIITAAPKGTTQNTQVGTVPVVDRSFSQQVRDVPVTGNGTQRAASQVVNQAEATLSASNLDGVAAAETVRQVANQSVASTGGGVIAIPQGTNSEWRTGVATTVNNKVDGVIVANTIPVSPVVNSEVEAAQKVLAATDSSANSAPTLSENDYYNQGFELVKQSKLEEAKTIFERQIKAYPRGDLADDAHYWIAEVMYTIQKLDVSKQHLKIIIKDYPQSARMPDAMLRLAYVEKSQGNKMEAQMLFQEIVSDHPRSDAAIAAKNQLAKSN